MKPLKQLMLALMMGITLWSVTASADSYTDSLINFKRSPQTEKLFSSAYGFAVFPTIGKAAFFIGGAYGTGQVYRGVYPELELLGESTMSQLSIGYSFGGEGYSEIIFFKNKHALDNFTQGEFAFGAQASAVALNIGANAQVGTTGNSATAGQSGTEQSTAASYVNDMAIFTATKGGLIIDASVAGQKFSFTPKQQSSEATEKAQAADVNNDDDQVATEPSKANDEAPSDADSSSVDSVSQDNNNAAQQQEVVDAPSTEAIQETDVTPPQANKPAESEKATDTLK
ncbi:lipid-binding SYLF domain-containing protein [Vibrio sp. S11_S32]|uniref:lipid-binding SYLF domain-containing protein n=1 Tax=Vibrio sp. S11_S32 TaxID=2720225 RepID=UPI0016801F33|nr:lipid-binding SYLF domain-containing protein [Vibrio sp. S11_S32]MBD1576389.1 lipid-binding SYLF domain-containing protein [Vibrio sp. S11_S32]